MRKIAATLLILVFVFNLFGYKLYVSFMVDNVNQSLNTALDNEEYSEAVLISIKQPTNLPYYNNTKEFTRAYGEVEVNGVHYQYVKCRIYNDSLEMLCIPNVAKQQLLNKKEAYQNIVLDLQQENKKSSATGKDIAFSKIFSEYENADGWHMDIVLRDQAINNNSFYSTSITTVLKKTAEQPPDHSSKFLSV